MSAGFAPEFGPATPKPQASDQPEALIYEFPARPQTPDIPKQRAPRENAETTRIINGLEHTGHHIRVPAGALPPVELLDQNGLGITTAGRLDSQTVKLIHELQAGAKKPMHFPPN